MTTIDYDMELPTAEYRPERTFQGQTFCKHLLENTAWKPWRLAGFESRDTGVDTATNGTVSEHVVRTMESAPKRQDSMHSADILFSFVLQDSFEFSVHRQENKLLEKGDAFVIPPNVAYQISHCSLEPELLEVTLPGKFTTSYID